MRLGYFADGPWSHEALQRIVEDSRFEIAFIVARYPDPDPVLKNHAEAFGVPFYSHENVNAEEFRKQIKDQCDLNVSMSFNQILKREIINLAPGEFINCHAGALPFYRGRNILNWALINGEERFGVTVHYVNEGIDTGDIIQQDFVPIESTDDYGSILEKAHRQCGVSLYEALIKLAEGTAQRTQQKTIHPVGFYCGRRVTGDEWIDWNWSSKRVCNFVRGISLPGPSARAMRGEQEFAILRVEQIPNAPDYIGNPGDVVGRTGSGVIVKTGDNVVEITKIADVVGRELQEGRTPKFCIGTRLGLNSHQRLRDLEDRLRKLEQG